jgi:hypothetical protein
LGNRRGHWTYPVAYRGLYGEGYVPLRRTSDGGFVIGTKTLLKLDSQGNQQWLRTYDGLTYALSVQQTPDGGYAATGPSLDYASIYLLKTRANGDTIWTRRYAPSEASSGYWVERTGDGGYVVAGSVDPGGNSWTKAILLRTAQDGSLSWTDSLCVGYANCVRQTSDGGYVISGNYIDVTNSNQSLFLKKLAHEQKRKQK